MLPLRLPRTATVLGALLVVSILLLAMQSAWAQVAILFALAGCLPVWFRAWRSAEGTTLRGALSWGAGAVGLAMAVQAVALVEGPSGDGPWTGRIAYLMTLAVLAGLISVLGARNPGGGAWAILMVLLVVVFLIPWLEVGGRIRRGEGVAGLQLLSPWTIFYGLLAMAGVTNYLPTRYGLSAVGLGLGLGLEYLGLTHPDWDASTRRQAWLGVAWFVALAAVLAGRAGAGAPARANGVDDIWRWFRDHWGVVWALRIQERFNRSAEGAAWPVRLTWYGLDRAGATGVSSGPIEVPEAAEGTLRTLIRRFATQGRVDLVVGDHRPQACHRVGPAG